MKDDNKEKKVIGRAELLRFPGLDNHKVHARVDSGANTSAIWGDARVENAKLIVSFFGDKEHEYTFDHYDQRMVTSSSGHIQHRYLVKLVTVLKGRKINASFTIADRKSQVYPVLIGRNVLRGKFVVDVKLGKALKSREKERSIKLQSLIRKEE